jgi:hypothetical protein
MKELVLILLALLVFSAGIFLSIARYNECRRYHPTWYCLTSGGK